MYSINFSNVNELRDGEERGREGRRGGGRRGEGREERWREERGGRRGEGGEGREERGREERGGRREGERGEGRESGYEIYSYPLACNHRSYSACVNCSTAIDQLIDSFSTSIAAYMTGDSLSDDQGTQAKMIQVASSTNLVKGFSKVKKLILLLSLNRSLPTPC